MALPGEGKRMPVASALITGFDGSHFADLFDDGKAEAVMARMLFAFIEPAEQSPGVQGYRQAGIADREAVGFQHNIDIAVGDIVVAGITEQVIQQDIDEIRACLDDGRGEVGGNLDAAFLPEFAKLPEFVFYFFFQRNFFEVVELPVADLGQKEQRLVEAG